MFAGEMLRESQKGEHSKFIWKIVEKQLQSLVNNVMNLICRIHKRVVFLKKSFDAFVLIKRYAVFPIKTFGMDENSFSMIYMYIEL